MRRKARKLQPRQLIGTLCLPHISLHCFNFVFQTERTKYLRKTKTTFSLIAITIAIVFTRVQPVHMLTSQKNVF